ncbi:10303_t:CDS:2 [Diversispora eburnea]|uniref:10303_t:CDS:1 n=1 Tax=Diversispora eburnea TaxID=1213867 RepID=A0A9N9BJP3_9GLOM|nr:10303_t:CDS:2 [Diversispora eburnea]
MTSSFSENFWRKVQQIEVDIALDYVRDTCPGTYQLDTDSNYTDYNKYEYAYVAASLVFFVLTFTIALKLYSAFGFGAYKRVEYNRKVRVISYAIITAAALPILGKSKYKIFYYFHSVILVIAIFSIVLCHYSYTRESKSGTYVYFALWSICVADFAFFIIDSVDTANSGWYFWTTVLNIFFFLLTFWYVVVALSNFGHGLKEILIDEENYEDVESLLDKASKEYKDFE